MKYDIRPLAWDSDFFGKSCARATISEKLTAEEMRALLDACGGYDFVTIDNACGEMYNGYLLGTMSRAFMTDCPVLLEKPIPQELTIDIGDIRIASPDEADALERLVNGSFRVTRFGNDPHISPEKTDALYRSWIRNAFSDPEKTVFTTTSLGGFLSVTSGGRVDLITVDKEQRGRGIAVRLLAAAEEMFRRKGVEKFLVGTQSGNIPALRLYEKFGFRAIRISQIYHVYKND